MERDKIYIKGYEIEVHSFNTVVVGTGASGFNAADRLWDYGQHDVAIVTEGINMGTSRNTGSDKQTYYKLTLAGGNGDSVVDMARTLFNGGCMHGELALCEAALSAQGFYKLIDIGVPFPHNSYGEYIGYKTDHDPWQRGTSAGPLTSKLMTEKLENRVKQKNIRIFDNLKVIGIVTKDGECQGLLAINKLEADMKKIFVLFNCTNVIFATGGPAGLYSCSVFPESQTGSNGIAFEVGIKGRNLTEWQYGIASIKFRWNLSGTYQQVIPKYISTDKDGNDPREFLDEYYPNSIMMLNGIFLKGYQWPFDPRKIENHASSLIDILVYNETQVKGRRVWLDFRSNPTALKNDFSNLGEEAYEYLERSNALFGTPFDRLVHMNRPAVDLYLSNNIDLSCEMLEIAVCAQHNNGGLAVNLWWETNIKHFFAVGEAAGTHGVYRPGGSALNSGQAGAARAALYIAKKYTQEPLDTKEFIKIAESFVIKKINMAEKFISPKEGINAWDIQRELGNRMSKYAAHIRALENIEKTISEARLHLESVTEITKAGSIGELVTAFENFDLLTAQLVYASAIADYIKKGGGSRGSYLVCDENGMQPVAGLPKDFRFSLDNGRLSSMVQEVLYKEDDGCSFLWEDVHPIPNADNWFENVWNDYMKDIYMDEC